MALAFDVAKPGNRLIYLRHGRQGAKVMPFSEELRVWPATGPAALRTEGFRGLVIAQGPASYSS